ncbi:TPA: hypothetical protein MIU54_10260 [Klebsiella pneumoniae]|nr:hypothetical protein [Klebsiella pneumoniae]
MGWGDYVRNQVEKILLSEGFSVPVAQGGGARHAEDLYNRMSQATKKGAIFDDALRHGRLWAEKQTSAAERREAKRKVRKGGDQAGLF